MHRSILTTALAATAALAIAGPGQAAILHFGTFLNGPNESPPNASLGTGLATITIDDALDTMLVDVSFSGLTGTTTASHVHCCTAVAGAGTAMVATELPLFTGFPTGVTAGTYTHTFDLNDAGSWNPAFVSGPGGGTLEGAENAFLAGLGSGAAYLNIHSTFKPGGEIRGFLAAIPEPGTWTLMLAGVGLAGAALRRGRALSPAQT